MCVFLCVYVCKSVCVKHSSIADCIHISVLCVCMYVIIQYSMFFHTVPTGDWNAQ